MPTGIKRRPSHDWQIVAVTVNAQPIAVVENDLETTMAGQVHAQWIAEAPQRQSDLVVTGRLDGLTNYAQGWYVVENAHGPLAWPSNSVNSVPLRRLLNCLVYLH